jgi:hypothetical protein
VGKDNPGRKPDPLDLASTPRDARYAMNYPCTYLGSAPSLQYAMTIPKYPLATFASVKVRAAERCVS